MASTVGRDPLDTLLGRYGGDCDWLPEGPRQVPRRVIVQCSSRHEGNRWRCLGCLAGGSGDEGSVNLAVEVHRAEGACDSALAFARAQLLDAIGDRSEAEFAAGWMQGIEATLLLRGGIWPLLAERLGWPVGWLGLEGWDPDLDAALARQGATRADLPLA